MEKEEIVAEEFVNLPEEIWELIFSFLLPRRHGHHFESLSLVCKQFYSITNRLRTSLRISKLTFQALPQIFSRFRRVKHINLQNFNGGRDFPLVRIANSGLDLESLNISNMKTIRLPFVFRALGGKMPNLRSLNCSKIMHLADDDLVLIAQSFPNLEELDISYPQETHNSYSFNPSRVVTDSGIFALAERLQRLCKVNISGHSLITDKALLALTTNCPRLKDLTIYDCTFITQAGLAAALRQSPNLISISTSDIGQGFIDSLVSMKNLNTLELSNSVIPDEFLHSIAKASLPLKNLKLNFCHNLSFSGISLLLSKNQFIERLELTATDFLTDQVVKELSQSLRWLKSINLSRCSNLTCSSLFTLARNCPNLNEIHMAKLNLEKEYDNATDFENPRVVTLNLFENKILCDESLIKIASIFPNLELLQLNRCVGITEQGIREVLMVCTKIRHLDVGFCYGIEDLVIDIELPAMEILGLQGLRIEDDALTVVGRRCPSLISLVLSGCFKVTTEGVREIVRYCRGLREIHLGFCTEIDEGVFPWMVFKRPSLRKIRTPHSDHFTKKQKQMFLQHGCMVKSSMFI